MQTLVIDRKASRLSVADRRLRIETPEGAPRFVPLAMIRRMIVTATVSIESNVLTRLAEQGASILLLSPRDHRRTAIVLPPLGGDHRLRLDQYRAVCDADFQARVAGVLVRMKLAAQLRFLRSLDGSRPNTRAALRHLPGMLAEMRKARELQHIAGLEGGAAAVYFPALAEHFPPSLGFERRRRRPPPDPVNALLSLGYTLLHFDAVQALHASGLDPCLGFLHAPAYNRESLACDCIEPLRPRVDRFVYGLFHDRLLRKEHFGLQQGACRLNKGGRAIFYREWEGFARPCRRALRRGAVMLKRGLAA